VDLNKEILDRLNDSELKQYSDIRDKYLPEKKLSYSDYYSLIEVIDILKKEWNELNEDRKNNKERKPKRRYNWVQDKPVSKIIYVVPKELEIKFRTLGNNTYFLENKILPIFQLYKTDESNENEQELTLEILVKKIESEFKPILIDLNKGGKRLYNTIIVKILRQYFSQYESLKPYQNPKEKEYYEDIITELNKSIFKKNKFDWYKVYKSSSTTI